MKNYLQKSLLLALAVMLLPMAAVAKGNLEKLQKVGAKEMKMAGVEQSSAIKNMNVGEANPFGQRLLEIMKANQTKLPASEAKISRIKPGKAPARAIAAEYANLEFSGMLQYNTVDDRMLLEYGFYRFGAKNGFVRERMADVAACFNGRGAYYNHKLHGVSSLPLPYYGSENFKYYEYDEDLWIPTGKNGTKTENMISQGADYNAKDGKCYGFMYSGSNTYAFCEIDYENISRKVICYTDSMMAAFAINSDGDAYAVSEKGMFCKVDLSSGALTDIGALDFSFACALQSMTFDESTGKLYLVASEIDWDEEVLLGRLCEVDVNTGKTTLVAHLPECEEYTCLHVLPYIEPAAPAEIKDLRLAFEGMTSDGKVTFTMPTKTVGGTAMSGNVDYTLTVNDDDANPITGSAAPGSAVSVDVKSTAEGRAKAVVVLAYNGVKGKRNAVSNFVGLDNPIAQNVKLRYNPSAKTFTVSWENNSVGEHGGYVDPSEVKFDVVRYPGAVKVATKTTDTSFTEDFDLTEKPYNGYYYEVTACVGQVAYTPVKTNMLVDGKALDVPFEESFDDEANFNRYTVYDMNEDGKTWFYAPYNNQCAVYEFSKENKAYDWMLMPPIHMEQDVAYKISFNVSAVSPAYREKLTVVVAPGEDPESEAAVTIMPETTFNNAMASPMTKELEFQATKTGNYRICFLCTSEKMQNAIFIDNIKVTSGLSLKTPDCAKNVVVTAAEGGILEATIDFDAPATTIGGDQLASIDKITIYRGADREVAKTLSNPEPGRHYSVLDEDAVNGNTTYYIIATNSYGDGLEASGTAYVGIDAPSAPEKVKLADNLDGTATLTWEATTVGQHGGYVDLDELTFDIVALVNSEVVVVKKGVTGNSFKVDGASKTGAPNALFYGVLASNDAGSSDYTAAAPLMIGKPYEMPLTEGFVPNKFACTWLTRSSHSKVLWNIYHYEGYSYDGDDFIIGVESEYKNNWALLNSAKISMAGATTPKLALAVNVIPGTSNVLNILVDKNGQSEPETAALVNFKDFTGEEGWRVILVDLSKYVGSEYITVAFEAHADDNKLPLILIDDMNIRNVVDDNLAVYAAPQSRTTAGEKATINVTVHNVGENEAGDYKVNFFVNGEIVNSVTSEAIVAPFDRARFSYDYTTKVSDPEKSKVWATVEYSSDNDPGDNESAHADLYVAAPLLNVVEGLTASVANGNAELKWNEVASKHNVTESFEGYESFLTSFGKWKTIDRDGSATATITGVVFPMSGRPFAFITFDFGAAGVDLKKYPDYVGNTGTQFAAAFKAVNSPRNDDWMISPELSGNEQIITLYAKSIAGTYDESFEICYSTTGTEVADFSSNVVASKSAPKDYFGRFSATLPEGAKYFAIHCNSQYGGIFAVDDISYEGKDLEVKYYNVYRDGALVGTSEAGQPSFTEPLAGLAPGQHQYNVTAVFAEGESAFSEKALIAVSGIDGVESSSIVVSGGDGEIRIAGAEGQYVEIFNLAGIKIFGGVCEGSTSVEAQAGIYLVKAATTVAKVVVK